MPEYCPRDKCAWTSPDGKCHWPTTNCPWKAERDAAAERRRAIEAAQAEVKAKERQRRQEEKRIQTTATGVAQMYNNKWRVIITAKKDGKQHKYHVGTFATEQEAVAIRHEAERQRADGKLEKWLKSRKKCNQQSKGVGK